MKVKQKSLKKSMYIKNKKHCIPKDIIDEITLALYLNIIEYVEINKQEKLLEMINMAEKYQGLIAQIKNEGKEEWTNKGERNIIVRLLKNHTFDEVAKLLEIGTDELFDILTM